MVDFRRKSCYNTGIFNERKEKRMYVILAHFNTPDGNEAFLLTKGTGSGPNVYGTVSEAVDEIDRYVREFVVDSPDLYMDESCTSRNLTYVRSVFRKEDMASWEFSAIPLSVCP